MGGFRCAISSRRSPALCALAFIGSAQAAEPVKIRMSWVAPVANWASIVLEKKDLAKHLGKSYTLESVRYQGTPPMITAIANGELEVSNLAYSIAGDRHRERQPRRHPRHRRRVPGRRGRPLHAPSSTCARTAAINKVEDLKGKVVGTNGGGSAVDIALRAMLQQARARGQARLHHRRRRRCRR